MNDNNDRTTVRMLVRSRDDFQAMRKRMDNRIGRKADGSMQKVERQLNKEDLVNFTLIADNARDQEEKIKKMLEKALKRFPIYNEFLAKVNGVGPVSAGWIIAEFDIEIATTVSKMWQFAGCNPGMVMGKKRVENEDGTFSLIPTGQMVRGDRLTPEHVAPFNKRLRTALLGVMADGFIKAQNDYAMRYYYPYKLRLEQESNLVQTDDAGKAKPWSEQSTGRRDQAAKRYMIKMFLKDLYVQWRTIEGLPVRNSYQEEYLGHEHIV